MAGLPHFKSSKAAMEAYEPVLLNQFEVIINPPTAVSNPQGNGGRKLLVENIIGITGLSVDKNPGIATQNYKFAQRRYAAAAVDDTAVKLKIDFEANLNKDNSNYVFKTLRQWSDLIYNPLTGAMGIKRDYAAGTYILISVFDKKGDVFRRVKLLNCFPTEQIQAMQLDYGNGNTPYKVSMSFRCDYFEDVFN